MINTSLYTLTFHWCFSCEFQLDNSSWIDQRMWLSLKALPLKMGSSQKFRSFEGYSGNLVVGGVNLDNFCMLDEPKTDALGLFVPNIHGRACYILGCHGCDMIYAKALSISQGPLAASSSKETSVPCHVILGIDRASVFEIRYSLSQCLKINNARTCHARSISTIVTTVDS